MKVCHLFQSYVHYFDKPIGVVREHETTFFYFKKRSGRVYRKAVEKHHQQPLSHELVFFTKVPKRIFRKKKIIAIESLGHTISNENEAYLITTEEGKEFRTFLFYLKVEKVPVFVYIRQIQDELYTVASPIGYRNRNEYVYYTCREKELFLSRTSDWKKFTSHILPKKYPHSGVVLGALPTEEGVFVFTDMSSREKKGTQLYITGTMFLLDDPQSVNALYNDVVLIDTFIQNHTVVPFAFLRDGVDIHIYLFNQSDFRLFSFTFQIPRTVYRINPYHKIVSRSPYNPLISPLSIHHMESCGTLNPTAWTDGETIHLIYRSIASDGVSRLSYASTSDGISVAYKEPTPVFSLDIPRDGVDKERIYSRVLYPSGGSWGGCEDPRMVEIDGTVYVTFNSFYGWDSIRIAYTTLSKKDFLARNWQWSFPQYISPEKEINKNWVLFPQKINGSFAILHNIWPNIGIQYVNTMEELTQGKQIIQKYWDSYKREGITPNHWVQVYAGTPGEKWVDPHILENSSWKIFGEKWDSWIRSSAASPILTEYGWLVLYHAMDKRYPHIGYKLGAMILDRDEPEKIIAKASAPILEPDMWYENDWKPGVVYCCGAVVRNDTLYIYYGGGDKHVCVATAPLEKFIKQIFIDTKI